MGHGRFHPDCSPVGQIGVVGHFLHELPKASGANDRAWTLFPTGDLFGPYVAGGEGPWRYRIGN